MKKLMILLVLFGLTVAIALGLVVSEQMKRTANTNPAQSPQGGSASSVGTESTKEKAAPTLPASTVEGNISLTISSPQNNLNTKDGTITVKGTTTPGANVMVNEFELTAGSDGSFSKTLTLDDGENYISVVAYTTSGNVAEKELKVIKEVDGY